MKDEKWVQIPEYFGLYKISTIGQIISFHKRNYNKSLKERIDRAGYKTVKLSKNGVTTTCFLHRLIASAFIPNPENKGFVNHIDGDKLNNDIENLEWCTHAENMQHAYKYGLLKVPDQYKKKVINSCTGEIYESIKVAANANNYCYSSLKNILNGKRKNKTCFQLAA